MPKQLRELDEILNQLETPTNLEAIKIAREDIIKLLERAYDKGVDSMVDFDEDEDFTCEDGCDECTMGDHCEYYDDDEDYDDDDDDDEFDDWDFDDDLDEDDEDDDEDEYIRNLLFDEE